LGSYEAARPSSVAILLSVLPVLMLLAMLWLTGFPEQPFSREPPVRLRIGTYELHPTLQGFIIPLVLNALAAFTSLLAFTTLKDEEPGWGPVLPFRVLESLNLVTLLLSIFSTVMLIFVFLFW